MTTEELTQLRYKTLIARLSQPDSKPTMVDLLAACHSALTKAQGKSVFVSKRTVQEDLRKLREGVLGQVYDIEVVEKKYYQLSSPIPKKKTKPKRPTSETVLPNTSQHYSTPFYLHGKSPEKAKAFFPLKTVDFGGQSWHVFLCPEEGTYSAIPRALMEKSIPLPDFPGWTKKIQSASTTQESSDTWVIPHQAWPFWAIHGLENWVIGEGKDHGWEIQGVPPWWLKYTSNQPTPLHEAWSKWDKKLVDRLDRKGYSPPVQVLSPLTNTLVHLAMPQEIPEQNEISLTPDELFWIKKWTGVSVWLKTLEKAWQLSFVVQGYWQATQNGMLPIADKEQKKVTKHQWSLYLNPSEDSDLHFSIWPGSHKQKEPDLFKPSKNLVLSPGQIWVCKTKLYRQVEWNPSTALVRLDLIPTFDSHDD